VPVVQRLVQRHPLTCFAVLACLFGWSVFLFAAAGIGSQPDNMPLGPVAAAAIVTACQGRTAVRAWLRRLIGWRGAPAVYALAVLVPVTIHVLDVLANHAFGAPLPSSAQLAGWPVIPVTFVAMFVLVGIGEEAGWSAFAAPTLLARHGLVVSWLLLAALRITWHLPLMLTGQLPWVIGILGNAGFQLALLVLFRAGAPWSVAVVWHATLNAFGGAFLFRMVTGADLARLGLLLGLAYAVVGALAYGWWRSAGAPTPTPAAPLEPPVAVDRPA
jgi:hypothetical protein